MDRLPSQWRTAELIAAKRLNGAPALAKHWNRSVDYFG